MWRSLWPLNGTIEIARTGTGSDYRTSWPAILIATGDARKVVPEYGSPRYFGARLEDGSLVSDNNPRLGKITFEQWFPTSFLLK